MLVKLYLYIISLVYSLEILMKISASTRALNLPPNYYELTFLGVWATFNVVAIYGFMSGKRIISGLFWKIYFIISFVLFISSFFGNIKEDFVFIEDYIVEFVFLLFIIPNYIFLFLYAYRFNWGTERGQ